MSNNTKGTHPLPLFKLSLYSYKNTLSSVSLPPFVPQQYVFYWFY